MLKKTVIALMMVGSFVGALPGPWNLSPGAHDRMAAERLASAQEIQKSLEKGLPAVTPKAKRTLAKKRNLVAIHRTHAHLHQLLAKSADDQTREGRVASNRRIQSLFGRLGRHHGRGATLTTDANERAMHNTMKSAANEAAAGSVSSPLRKVVKGHLVRAGATQGLVRTPSLPAAVRPVRPVRR